MPPTGRCLRACPAAAPLPRCSTSYKLQPTIAPPLAAGLSTPKVNIPPLGIAVSAQPIGVSVSNKGEIPSDHDAIGMTDAFWVGANKDKEKRVVQGNLYITGSITVEPIVQQSDKVTIGVVGDGKVGWGPRGRAGTARTLDLPACCAMARRVRQWGGCGACQRVAACPPTSKTKPNPPPALPRPTLSIVQAVISWTGGRTESIYKVETIPTITIFDIV